MIGAGEILSLLLATAAAAGPAIEVRTLGGEQAAGKLVELSDERVVIEGAQGPSEFATRDLMALSPSNQTEQPAAGEPESHILVDLVDTSRLQATSFTVQGKKVTLEALGQTFTLTTDDVRAVRFVPPGSKFDQLWADVVGKPATADRLVIQKQDAFDYLEGVVRDIDQENVQFDLGAVRPVKRTRVAGIAYFQREQERDAPAAVVELRDGSRLAAQKLALGDHQLRLTLLGQELAVPFEQVAKIDFSAGKIQFLSDLEPESSVRTPLVGYEQSLDALSALFAPKRDQAFQGEPLLLGGKEYREGLALHSQTELVYRLPPNTRRFVAIAGIDDRFRPQGHVQLVIEGDGKQLYSQPISGADEPKAIELDLDGVKRLKILVGFGQGADVGDHLNLCEARVTQ